MLQVMHSGFKSEYGGKLFGPPLAYSPIPIGIILQPNLALCLFGGLERNREARHVPLLWGECNIWLPEACTPIASWHECQGVVTESKRWHLNFTNHLQGRFSC